MVTTEKDPAAVSLGRKGGLARAQSLTAKRRKEIALTAAKAAAAARTRRARQKKKEKSS